MAKLSAIEKPVFVVTDNQTIRIDLIDSVCRGYDTDNNQYWLRIEWNESQCPISYNTEVERDQDYSNLQTWINKL